MKSATYWGVPCWFNEHTFELIGKNWFYDKIIDIFVWVDVEFNDGFYIKIKE